MLIDCVHQLTTLAVVLACAQGSDYGNNKDEGLSYYTDHGGDNEMNSYGSSDSYGGAYNSGYEGKYGNIGPESLDSYGPSDYYGGNDGSYSDHTINAAIMSHKSIKTIPISVNSGDNVKPTLINLDSSTAPIMLRIKTISSPIIPKYTHVGADGSFKKTYSADKPHKHVHIVKKPVIHELKEMIIPFRKHMQRVRPVKQYIKTMVPMNGYSGGGNGYNNPYY